MRKTLLLKKGLVTAAFTFVGALTAFADSVVLYESDFSTDPTLDGWRAVDKSTKTGTTWEFKSNGLQNGASDYNYGPVVRIMRDWYALDNDYFVSPAMELKAGVTYKIRTATVINNNATITFEVGSSNEDMSTFSSVKTLTGTRNTYKGDDMYETVEYTPTADGTYYFAYHAVQTAEGSGNAYLAGLKVEYEESTTEPTEPTDPVQPGESDTKYLFDTDFSTDPTLDGWKTVDKSTKTGTTWEFKSNGLQNGASDYNYGPVVRIMRDWYALDNDYFVSPAVELKAGTKYSITTGTVINNNATITFEVGSSNEDMSTFNSIKTLTGTRNSYKCDEMNETFEYTPEADGTYYFAYHAVQTAEGSGNAYLTGLKVSYEEASSTPDKPDTPDQPGEDNTLLNADFATEPADWVVIDNDKDNTTWTYKLYSSFESKPAVQYLQYKFGNGADDYYVSPALELKKGVKYNVTTAATYSNEQPTITLELGTAQKDASTFSKVADIIPSATYDGREAVNEVTVPADGTYYLAYHIKATTGGGAKAFLFGLKVEKSKEVTPPTPVEVTPAAVTALEGAVDYDAATVTLTWTNPTKDAEGNDLTDKVGAKIYKGEDTEPIKTIDELTGETTSVAVSPEPFEGDVTFTVKTFIGEKESEAATVSLNLDKPVAPDTSKELPYTADMTDAETVKDFTVLDANNDNITWATVEGINGLTYDSDNATAAANDWLISPAIKFAENTNYAVVANFTRSGAFDNDVVEVYAGDEANAEKMTKKIGSFEIADNAAEAKLRYICADANAKFIGFHIATPNGDNGQISLTSVSISAIESATPLAVENLDAQVNSDDKTVTLTWANPTKDTEGYDIAQTVGVKVYENDVLVKTLDDATEGKLVYSPENFSGEATYKVVSFIGDKDGEAASKTVNLDDLNGELVLVRAFEFTKTAANYWTIINADKNTSKWAFDYDCFLFSGGSEADDWLISPAASLSKKDRYVLKYQMKTAWKPSNNDFYADVDVTIGNGTTAEAQTTVLKSYKGLSQNSFTEYKTSQFSVAEDGQYNIGFHVTGINGNMSMRNLAIYSIGEPTTGINEIVNSGVVAYNKANGALFLPAGSKMALYAANGSVAMQAVADGQAINLNSLANGIYVMKVTTAEGKVMTRKIVK